MSSSKGGAGDEDASNGPASSRKRSRRDSHAPVSRFAKEGKTCLTVSYCCRAQIYKLIAAAPAALPLVLIRYTRCSSVTRLQQRSLLVSHSAKHTADLCYCMPNRMWWQRSSTTSTVSHLLAQSLMMWLLATAMLSKRLWILAEC
jgi:hypothetical protein